MDSSPDNSLSGNYRYGKLHTALMNYKYELVITAENGEHVLTLSAPNLELLEEKLRYIPKQIEDYENKNEVDSDVEYKRHLEQVPF